MYNSSIIACILLHEGPKPRKHIRRFGCTTGELHQLAAWLSELGVEHVAIESTGVYWKPVWNILEGHFRLLLANAQHIKAFRDARPIRRLSADRGAATRTPASQLHTSGFDSRLARFNQSTHQLSKEHSRIASRIQKVLEDANRTKIPV